MRGWEPKRTTTVTKWRKGKAAEWVTTTEPEFDPIERDGWVALDEYEDALCPQCGQLRSICEDPERIWNPQIHGCAATAARSMYSREWQKRHADTKPDEDHWHPTDGSMVWVSPDLEPDDEFLAESLPHGALSAAPSDAPDE